MTKRLNNNFSDYCQEQVEKIAQEADKYTYPIFTKSDGKKANLIGSSVVLKLNNIYYLITASHIVKTILNKNGLFYIGVKSNLVDLSGTFVHSKNIKDEYIGDDFDIAYLKLSLDFIEKNNIISLGEEKIHIGEIKKQPCISLIYGFPNSQNKIGKAYYNNGNKFRLKSYSYNGFINFDYLNESNKIKENHTCMNYNNKTMKDRNPKSPIGISGGGLWIVQNILCPSDFLLDSICIEYSEKEKIVLATKIHKVVTFINKTLCGEEECIVDL